MLADDGVFYASIDENERSNLALIAKASFPIDLCEVAVQTNAKGRAMDRQFSRTHEYLLARSKQNLTYSISKPKGAERIERDYPHTERGVRFRLLEFRNTHREFGRHNRPKMWFPIHVSIADGRVSLSEFPGSVSVFPIWDDGFEGCWTGREWNIAKNPDHFIGRETKGRWKVYAKDFAEGSMTRPKSIWNDPEFLTEKGSSALCGLLGLAAKDDGLIAELRPKPPALIAEAIVNLPFKSLLVLDYFSGSGTTGQSVIELNREDGGSRKFLLVEQGEYFWVVLLPRIAKLIACPSWEDGRPKADIVMDGDETHWSFRSPALVQVLQLERYEDSLDALELPSEAAARRAGQMSFAGDSLLRYVHEAAAGKASVTLNHTQLSRPFDLKIPQHRHGSPVLVDVDLAATAMLLLGLHPVRLRDLPRKDKIARRYLFIEARPNGKPKERHLVILRDCDDSLTGEAAQSHAVAEASWIVEAVRRELGSKLGAYQTIWYNRDAVLPSTNGRSLDPEVIRRMMERAPAERLQ
jgi:adenine-specific DNA-methyltransferase